LRLVILTRRRPALPVHRYRLEGRIAEIGVDDLRFTRGEVAATLACHGLRPSKKAVEAVSRETEGWAAGVRLAALALQDLGTATPSVQQVRACLTPTGTLLADYLGAEVIAAISAGDLDLLRACSVVDSVPASLADLLTGTPQAGDALAELSDRDQFVRHVRGSTDTFRMHSLLRAWLYTHFRSEQPEEVVRLHRRAADWLAASGSPAAAVDQAVRAGDWAFAVRLAVAPVAVAGMLVGMPATDDLAARLADLPVELDTPAVAVLRAALAVIAGDLPRADSHLAQPATDPASDRYVALSMALVRTRLCHASGEVAGTLASARDARLVLRDLPEDGHWERAVHLLLQSSEAAALFRSGDLDAAAALLSDTLQRCVDHGCEPPRLDCLTMLALIEACRGRLVRAQELAETAEKLAVRSGIPATRQRAAGHLARAWVATERQERSLAQHFLGRAARLDELRHDSMLASVAVLLRVRLMRDRGDASGARKLLANRPADVPWVSAEFDAEVAHFASAGAASHLEQGGRGERPPSSAAEDLGGSASGDRTGILVESREQTIDTVSSQIDHLLLCAQRHYLHGGDDAGRSLVLQALTLGKAERLRRPFFHAGPHVRALMRTDQEVAARAAWLGPRTATRSNEPVLQARPQSSPDAAPDPQGTGEIHGFLTEREQEVLRNLAAMLSTQEIAATMFISVNTVRTHIRHILDKFSVARRNEAVRRARHLGLV
jgi:LuxR family transcriptional regulator, maltose regulon positive regulatory protein